MLHVVLFSMASALIMHEPKCQIRKQLLWGLLSQLIETIGLCMFESLVGAAFILAPYSAFQMSVVKTQNGVITPGNHNNQ